MKTELMAVTLDKTFNALERPTNLEHAAAGDEEATRFLVEEAMRENVGG